MDFLKAILGDGYAAFETAVKAWNEKPENRDKQVKIADIGTGDYVGKGKFDALEAVKINLETQLQTVNASLKKFEGIDPDKLQGEITTLQTELNNQKQAAANTKKEYVLRDKLKEAGVMDADYVIYKQGGIDKFNFDKDGSPIGIEETVKPLKESSPHLFKAEAGGGYKPNGGGNPPAVNPFAKDTYNLTEQGRLLKENPTQAKQLAASAGVTI